MTAWRLPQIDHLRAARALGKRTGVCVFSWDHLSSKALLRQVPDRVLLWNETQKQRSDQVARDAGGPHRRYRRAVLRPVVRPAPVSRSSLVLPRVGLIPTSRCFCMSARS